MWEFFEFVFEIKLFLYTGDDKIDFCEQISEGGKTLSLILVFFKKIIIKLNKKGNKTMAKQEQLQFFCIFKEEKIDFQTLLEKVFIEFIQEKENKNKFSKP